LMQKKPFDKTQHHFMIKALKKLWLVGKYLNRIKPIYEKPIANTILNGEKLKRAPLKSGMRQRYLLSPLLFNMVQKFLASTLRQEKEIKEIQIGRRQITLIIRWYDSIHKRLQIIHKRTPKSHKHFGKHSHL
jgi:hypothetical protein